MTKTEKSWSKKSPAGPWDYIVIGSGMGGMTSAALLAKLGHRVLVLEQHYVPGGFTHTFTRKGYRWDVGVHAVGEVTDRNMTGRLLTRLTDGNLKWASLGKTYEQFYYPDDFRIDFPDTREQFRENLIAAFPDQAPAIDRYLEEIKEVAGAMKPYYLAKALPNHLGSVGDMTLGRAAQKHLQRKTWDVIQELTNDPKLQSVLTAQWGYYGSPPRRSSFAMQALVVRHFWHGAYYPIGGSQQIANCLLKTVADAGGWTRIYADVEKILIRGGKAVGVRLNNGEEILGNKIISAAGVLSTIKRMLPYEYRDEDWAREISELAPAPAHVCLHLGLKGDIRKADASAANKWFYNTWNLDSESWDVSGDGPLKDAEILYCSFPSLKDPMHDPGPEQRHTAEVVTFVPWETFEPWQGRKWKKRGAEYDALKKRMEDKLLDQFLKRMPQLKPMVDYVELSTPLSTDHFVRPVAGSIYGLEPTPKRFRDKWLRPNAPIKNLYFSGSEVSTVGVIGAMMGGVLAALAAEPVAAFRYLRQG